MAANTTKIRFDYMCPSGTNFSRHEDLPNQVVQGGNPMTATSPAFRQAYYQCMMPIMAAVQKQCVEASSPNCTVCKNQPTKSCLTTPMSYLHLSDPCIKVLVLPICSSLQCESNGKAMVNEMMKSGMAAAQAQTQAQPAKGAPCPCGSQRKYKKCCGVTKDDIYDSNAYDLD